MMQFSLIVLFFSSNLFYWQKDFSLCQQKVTYIRDMATGPALRKFLSNPLHSNHFHS